jgi:hypothetical protein
MDYSLLEGKNRDLGNSCKPHGPLRSGAVTESISIAVMIETGVHFGKDHEKRSSIKTVA